MPLQLLGKNDLTTSSTQSRLQVYININKSTDRPTWATEEERRLYMSIYININKSTDRHYSSAFAAQILVEVFSKHFTLSHESYFMETFYG